MYVVVPVWSWPVRRVRGRAGSSCVVVAGRDVVCEVRCVCARGRDIVWA